MIQTFRFVRLDEGERCGRT